MNKNGITAVQVVVIVVVVIVACLVVGFLAVVPTLQRANEMTNRTVCMSNLMGIGKALTLYKGTNNNLWPWLRDDLKNWDTTPTGRNRESTRNPFKDANDTSPRAVTSLMFLLVHDGEPTKQFVCPSTDKTPERSVYDEGRFDEDGEPLPFWDFSSYKNVSYSWQAPIEDKDGNYRQGVSDSDPDAVLCSDMTPAADRTMKWDNTAWDYKLQGRAVEPHVGPNHRGKQVNVLYVGMHVAKSDRPDIGANRDMIFTASGERRRGSRKATSISISDHKSARDSFLIGPVGAPKKP